MKTSKIKTIVNVKDWDGGNGVVYYQSLEMENGDKINIGKKKKLEVGEELTYEIIDTQQEYNKARSVNPKFAQGGGGQANRSNNYDTQLLIVRQSSLKAAVDCCKGDTCSPKDIIEIADIFTDWVLSGDVAKENKKDLPF